MARRTSSPGRPPSSTTRSAKTIEAAPRGPNHARNATVGRRAPVPSSEIGDGEHAHDGEAEDRVQGDLPRDVSESGAEEDGAEDDERDGREDGARLLDEVRDLAAPAPAQPAEDAAADEGRDEPRASDRLREAECEPGARERYDLEPRGVDEPTPSCLHDDRGGRGPGDRAAERAVADLLEHELDGVPVPDRPLLRLGDRERDQEERHADPVVQPALHVEALPDAHREPLERDDGLPERGVGGREDDREDERLRPAEVVEQDERDARSRRAA